MAKNLLDKVWDIHSVKTLDSGQTQLFVGLHLIHEVTSPQAFQMLRDKKLDVLYPERTFATVDHVVPTTTNGLSINDPLAVEMMNALKRNTEEFGIRFFGLDSDKQGIVHVIGPELGLTQPGMTIACGDSHTTTHGAFGSVAFGIGTSQVRDILATQTLALSKPKVMRINLDGQLNPGVYSKDVSLKVIRTLGVNGGIGYAYEFTGSAVEKMSMEERMTLCNMSIESGARCGYVNPDQTTFDFIKGREFAPVNFEEAIKYWRSIASDPDALFDLEVTIDVDKIEPMVTWGINPGQVAGISENVPYVDDLPESERDTARHAYNHMGFVEGQYIEGTKIDVAFVGSCANSRISDLREAAKIVAGKKVAPNVKALVVPGSKAIRKNAMKEGLDKIFIDAGFEWRESGCSMCLSMNPDKLYGREICASSSNRNYIGRQGSPQGRTLLMSPAMVAAAAIHGKVVDVREL